MKLADFKEVKDLVERYQYYNYLLHEQNNPMFYVKNYDTQGNPLCTIVSNSDNNFPMFYKDIETAIAKHLGELRANLKNFGVEVV